jgi:hypothetical protein
MKISFVAIVSSVVLIFVIVEYQLQYADGIASSSTICINGKCVTKVCTENEPCKTTGDNSTSGFNDIFLPQVLSVSVRAIMAMAILIIEKIMTITAKTTFQVDYYIRLD